jgi:hypothetical protein
VIAQIAPGDGLFIPRMPPGCVAATGGVCVWCLMSPGVTALGYLYRAAPDLVDSSGARVARLGIIPARTIPRARRESPHGHATNVGTVSSPDINALGCELLASAPCKRGPARHLRGDSGTTGGRRRPAPSSVLPGRGRPPGTCCCRPLPLQSHWVH